MSNKIITPKVDTRLLAQAAAIAGNLVGYPCEIVLFDDGQGNVVGYRVQPDLKMVELNIVVYTHLKEFSKWYLEAHAINTAPGKIKTFENLITAIFDFGGYWEVFKNIDPARADVTVQLCRQAMQAASADIAKEIEKRKAGN